MSLTIIEKKDELINAIKDSIEYKDYLNAKNDLKKHPEQSDYLDEYKKLLIESQLSQFLGDSINRSTLEEIDEIYDKLSKYEVINNYLNAEYKLKNMLHGIYQDLSYIVDSKDGRNNFFI